MPRAGLPDAICYEFPLECPKCAAVSGMPYKASALPGAVAVDVRCKDCQHEWRCLLQSSAAVLTTPKPDRRKTPRDGARAKRR